MASIFVNLTNCYAKPKQKGADEMKKIAEFAKHHVPEVNYIINPTIHSLLHLYCIGTRKGQRTICE
jgi:hypothetical protein